MNFKSLIKPPYSLFIYAAIVVAVASLFLTNDKVDIHLDDTYFVISTPYILWAVAFSLICVWGVYRTVNNILFSNALTWLHSIATVFVLIALSTSGFWFKENNPPSRRYYSDDSFSALIGEYGMVFFEFLAVIVIFLIGQLAFVINVLTGFVRYFLTKDTKGNLSPNINKN